MKNGFTLIELIVIISVVGVLSIVGIASFVTYSRIQSLNSAVSDFVTTIHLAKSRAQSQVKPTERCASNRQLNGYKVSVCGFPSSTCVSTKDYELTIVCEGSTVSPAIESKRLLQNITFVSGGTTSTSFFFKVIIGGVVGAGDVVINGYGRSKTVRVDANGNITVR